MPGLDGLELARVIGGLPDPPAVVFVTAHDDYAVAAFDLCAVDYLLKPLSRCRLAKAVDRIVETRRLAQADDPDTVPVELGGRIRFVDRATIRYVEAQGDYVRLHTESGGYLVRASLGTLERRWEAAGFVRIHRSTLVNTRHVAELRLEGGRAAVKVGEELLPVSRRQTREVRDQLVRRLQPRSGP
ncbi:MAG: response regulator [Streptosporangiales bacterium]|nr:response regulator [Streptosporangiales bacterium]